MVMPITCRPKRHGIQKGRLARGRAQLVIRQVRTGSNPHVGGKRLPVVFGRDFIPSSPDGPKMIYGIHARHFGFNMAVDVGLLMIGLTSSIDTNSNADRAHTQSVDNGEPWASETGNGTLVAVAMALCVVDLTPTAPGLKRGNGTLSAVA